MPSYRPFHNSLPVSIVRERGGKYEMMGCMLIYKSVHENQFKNKKLASQTKLKIIKK